MEFPKSSLNEIRWFLARGKHCNDPLDKFIFFFSAFNILYSGLLGKGPEWRGEMNLGDMKKLLSRIDANVDSVLGEAMNSFAKHGFKKPASLEDALMEIHSIRHLVFRPSRTDMQSVGYDVLIVCNMILEFVVDSISSGLRQKVQT